MKRPTISVGLSLKDWNFYKQEWERYKTDSHDPDPAITVNQLLECLDEALRKHVSSMVGDRLKTINEVDLLLEIEKLVVEKQSNLVHTVALMSATQERDEGVRQYVARLRGLAAVCVNYGQLATTSFGEEP